MHRQIAGKLTSPVTKWFVLVAWLLIAMVVGGIFGTKLSSVENNQAQSWLPQSAEATKALNAMSVFQNKNNIPTSLVWQRASGLTASDKAAIGSDVAAIAKLPEAKALTPAGTPTTPADLIKYSANNQVAQATITFNYGAAGWNKIGNTAKDIHKIAKLDGANFYITGPGGQAADSSAAFSGIDGKLLFITIGVVMLILLFTYRSPLLWLLPVISAGTALFTAQGVIYLLADHAGLTVNGQSAGILTVLVFGAGTDYALLLVARYREELRRHEDRHEAMAFALHRAAPAIIASALTVVLGMLCLLFASMNSTKGLGPVTAIGVGVGLLVMITLLPALLVIFGRWLFWPARPSFGSAEPTAAGLWARMGKRIAVRPRTIWVGTAIVLAALAIGVVKLNPHGLGSSDTYTTTQGSITGQNVLQKAGLADTSNQAQIVTTPQAAGAVSAAAAHVNDVSNVVIAPESKGGLALVIADMGGDPTSQAAYNTVDHLRSAVHAVPGARALVGGGTAINADIETASARDTRVIIPIVLAVVLLVLMLLLRAVLSPVILILTVVLSFGAALGISSLVFHYIFGFAGADASFPLFVFVFLVALGIDYNIFLMTRVREETATHGTRRGSLIALQATGGVITSAGLVLAATFSVLGSLPLVFLAEMGTAVALGVLLDTIVVRSVLVTAINLDLGAKIWWPSKLDRTDSARIPS